MLESKTLRETLVLAAALASATVASLRAQAPPASAVPLIELAQPAPGATVPRDKPVVLFRFSAADPSDPIDAGSFAVTVDGENRTSLFRLTAAEAWGPLAPPTEDGALDIAQGVHRIAARICSVRGVCAELTEQLTVVASEAAVNDAPLDRKRSLLELLLLALRKLIEP